MRREKKKSKLNNLEETLAALAAKMEELRTLQAENDALEGSQKFLEVQIRAKTEALAAAEAGAAVGEAAGAASAAAVPVQQAYLKGDAPKTLDLITQKAWEDAVSKP